MTQKKSLKARLLKIRAERNRKRAAANARRSKKTLAAMLKDTAALAGTPSETIHRVIIDVNETVRVDEGAHQFAEAALKASGNYQKGEHPQFEVEGLALDKADWGKFAGYDRVHGYFALEEVLGRAYNQAASGKGHERHGRGAAFDEQPTQIISGLLDTDAGLAFQAIKKINEGMRLEHDAKIKEMLGAINYIASIVIYMEANKK